MYFYWQICLWWRTSGFVPQFHWWVRPSKGRHLTPKPDLRLWTLASRGPAKIEDIWTKILGTDVLYIGAGTENWTLKANFWRPTSSSAGLQNQVSKDWGRAPTYLSNVRPHFWNALYIYIPSGAKESDGRAAMAAGDVINRLMKSWPIRRPTPVQVLVWKPDANWSDI